MKNHQINNATNGNYSGSRKEKQACEIQLVIVRLPEDFEKVADPEALEELRSWGFGPGPSWKDVDGAKWHPIDDEEVANAMLIAPVESITEESYRRFSRVVLPLFGGLYGFFSREETPPLDWIKRTFINHIAVVQYWRHKKSDHKVSSVGNESCRTISQGLTQTIQGAMAQAAACICLGISDEELKKTCRMNHDVPCEHHDSSFSYRTKRR
jgi:hypothetical protein